MQYLRIILTTIFLLVSFCLFGQYYSIPSRQHFNKLCLKYGSDTITLGEHKIVKVSYKKKYLFGYDKGISALFDFKVYLIDNKYIIKSYKDIVHNGGKIDLFGFTLDKNISDIFQFPDSSIGVFIYTYDSPMSYGACGACSEEHLKLYRFSQKRSQIVFDFQTDNFHPTIQLNDSLIFPVSEQSKMYNCLKFKENDVYCQTVYVKWNKSKTELAFSFRFSDYEPKKGTEIIVERARLIAKFLKKGKDYYLKTNCH